MVASLATCVITPCHVSPASGSRVQKMLAAGVVVREGLAEALDRALTGFNPSQEIIHDEAISRVAHSVKVSTKLDVATMSIRAAGQVS